MDWLNYHHLFYFWTTAREGSISRASQKLLLSPATISTQIRELEQALGQKLFQRSGRGLSLTEAGQVAYRYATEIFALGREFVDALQGRTTPAAIRVRVGINDVIPKLMAYQFLEPLFNSPERIRVECIQGTPEQLLGPLAVHDLDLVISDAPVREDIRVRAYSHLLGESPIQIYAAPRLARGLRKGFPKSLDNAPALLPAAGSVLRNILDKWFESLHIRPDIVAECEDMTLLSICGERGLGFFAGYGVIEQQIGRAYGVQVVGTLEGVRGRFYAISVERRIKSPAAAAITHAARARLD